MDQKIQESIFTDKMLDKESLKTLLLQDMRSCVIFMNEVLGIPEAVDALTDIYYKRYTAFYETKNQVPDPEGVPVSLKTTLEDVIAPSQTKLEI